MNIQLSLFPSENVKLLNDSGCLLTKFRFGFVQNSMEICLFCSLVSADIALTLHTSILINKQQYFFATKNVQSFIIFLKIFFPGFGGGRSDMIQIDGF